MSEHDHDDALARRLAELYRAGSVEEPAPELDRRILDAAASGPPRRRRWPIAGLATAAAAVLAVALTLPPDVEEPAFEAADAQAPASTESRAEKIIVTGALYRAAEAPEPAPPAAESPAPATPTAAHYTDPACPSSYALPPDAVIRSVPGGIVVRSGAEAFRLRCVDGGWQREPVPQ